MQQQGNIKPIDRKSVHQICSGQVVLTLAIAVKELVENSLDAGATNIEVKLKEYGSELIEVSDNGSGVKECDFRGLTMKHHTSKLSNFSDLTNVLTFGFRGEALSSLCALSKMTIVTCHKSNEIAARLEFDHDGTIVKESKVARQVGTTISLENLFYTLPVRYKEFQKNLKKEFGKMVNLLTAYCLISTGKRINCVNITSKGRKSTVVSTNGDSSIRSQLNCLFGTKQVRNLMEFVQNPPSEAVLEEFTLTNLLDNDLYRIEGFISSHTHGEGRSTTDRQFFFINGRPCELSKAAKILNDVYHSFNKHQYPFVCLNIVLKEGSVDVNVTPDKRQVFVTEEKLLLAILKTSVMSMYSSQPVEIKQVSPLITTYNGFNVTQKNSIKEVSEQSVSLKRVFSFVSEGESDERQVKNCSQVSTDDDHKEIDEEMSSQELNQSSSSLSELSPHSEASQGLLERRDMDSYLSQFLQMDSSPVSSKVKHSKKNQVNSSQSVNFTSTQLFKEEKIIKKVKLQDFDSPQSSLFNNFAKFRCHTSNQRPPKSGCANSPKNNCKNTMDSIEDDNYIDFIIEKHSRELNSIIGKSSQTTGQEKSEIFHPESSIVANMNDEPLQETCDTTQDNLPVIISTDVPSVRKRKVISCNFSMQDLKERWSNREMVCSSHFSAHRKFRSKLSADDAEDELRKEISKEMFKEMEIIGQFNLGFIITRLQEDLFIIDQHATDEKYNFEQLQKDTVLEAQILLNPQSLQLTAASEAILLDNIQIFEKNGFKFHIEEENHTGNKIKLSSIPISQNYTFGKEDIDELVFMLTDNPGRMCRPSRVSQMFASRACRKSVMIGTALNYSIMKKLVCHMGEIEQPWNCPHGRPTLRHLLNLNLLNS